MKGDQPGLRRLLGDQAYERLRRLRVCVVGLGGVGSWAAEALARSGVAGLTLIDLDHVSESNINRQVQALGRTLGQAKAEALKLLRQPETRETLSRSPQALAPIKTLMQAAGLAA